jgi:hypothetical protein
MKAPGLHHYTARDDREDEGKDQKDQANVLHQGVVLMRSWPLVLQVKVTRCPAV